MSARSITDAMRGAGLSQATAARLIGCSRAAVSLAIKAGKYGARRHLATILAAWRIMTPDQRDAWLADRTAATIAGETGAGIHAALVARAPRRPQPSCPAQQGAAKRRFRHREGGNP